MTALSAKIPSMAWRFVLLVATIMTLAASQIYFSLQPETKRFILLAAAGRTFPLLKSDRTFLKCSLQRSRKKTQSSPPSSVSTVPLPHAAGSWDPSLKACLLAKCTPVPHQAAGGEPVVNVANSTLASGCTSVVPTRTPLKSSSSAMLLGGLAAQAVRR